MPVEMRSRLTTTVDRLAAALIVFALVLLGGCGSFSPVVTAHAQDLGELFRKVSQSVVVVRAKGREVSVSRGVAGFTETGSGVLISADGKVMTAAHVVHTMDEIAVEFLGGETVGARVISSEPGADLSLLQLERVPAGAEVAALGDSDKIGVGAQVMVVGAPYGLSHSLSAGWISARWPPNTVYRSMPLAEFFQTNATINTGNSGGPMFSMSGEAIGIVSHIISKSGGSEGLGFVVTMNTARELLLEKQSFWGGLEGTFVSGDLAEILNVPGGAGYLVKTVAKDSPAWKAGVLGGDRTATIGGDTIVVRGDVILEVAGIAVKEATDFVGVRQRLEAMTSGAPISISVLRAGQILELTGRAP
jgi:S1-C subfamily serine protease